MRRTAALLLLLLLLWRQGCQLTSHRGLYGYRDIEGQDIPQGAATLAFVFDITGSMYDDHVQVIEGANKILNTILARREKPIYNYALVPFHDPEIGPVTVTTDPELFQKHLKELYVQGGGDCPEMSIGAIKLALEFSLPNSHIYVFTDARAKDFPLLEEVLKLIQKKESQVVFVMTGDCGNHSHPGYQSYEQIASTSSGQVFHLKKSDVDEVLNFVRVSLQARKVNLFAADRGLGDVQQFEFDVDSSLREFTVSLSGDNPRILLMDPSGNVLDETTGLNELLHLNNVLIVNVKDPPPGQWRVRVSSDSPHTVRATGLSKLDFVHGFSLQATPNLRETYHRPLTGAPTHLLINATELPQPGSFLTAQLVDLEGKLLKEVPLHRVPGTAALFNATTFYPPEQYFYLKVTGVDEEGYQVQRITSTAISAQLPDVPELTTRPRINANHGATVTLNCYIQSLVPYTVFWTKDGIPISQEQQFPQTTEISLTVPDVTGLSEGWYSCNATNAAGPVSSVTFLDVIERPPVISQSSNISAALGSRVVLPCSASSVVDHNVTWNRLTDDKVYFSLPDDAHLVQHSNGSLVVLDVRPNDQGWYQCHAANEGGSDHQELYLAIYYVPRVALNPLNSSFVSGDTVNLTCLAAGYPDPVVRWTWHNRRGYFVNSPNILVQGNKLIIARADVHDEGRYLCNASNEAGSAFQTGYLHYLEPPQITVPQRRVLAGQREQAVLQCVVRGIPAPSVKWFRYNREVQPTAYKQATADGVLTILDAREMDAGEYTCVAINTAGTAYESLTLDIGSAPLVIQAPVPTSVDINTDGSIPCLATGFPMPNVTWRHDGVLDIQRHFVAPNGTLIIRNADVTDQGTYVCKVENRFGHQELKATLTVTGVVPPVINSTTSDVQVKRGHSATLPCHVVSGNPKPEVQWFNEDKLIVNGGDISVLPDGSLVINNVKDFQEGNYTCLAQNVGGNSTHNVTLHVLTPPAIVQSGEKEYTAKEGSPVTLPCDVKGDPPPVISWQKNGIPILRNHPHYRLHDDGRLEIVSLTEEDGATYVCTAANVAGVTNKATVLHVQVPPRIAADKHTYHAVEGDTVTISCNVHAVPPADIEWRRQGSRLQSDHIQLTSGGLRFRARAADADSYICDARNPVGSASKETSLVVFVPPTVDVSGPENAITGDTVQLSCSASGSPPPEIQWIKKGQSTTLSDGEGRLIIKSVDLSDAGDYTCVASNVAGTGSRAVQLSVYDPPKIVSERSSQLNVLQGQEAVMTCESTGFPIATISWKRNGETLTGNELGLTMENDSLYIGQTQVTDTGQYECLVQNSVGNDSAFFNLTILVVPVLNKRNMQDILEVVEGHAAVFMCPASAIPPPEITWYKDNAPFNLQGPSRRQTLDGGQRLVIPNSSTEDGGKYTCVASNIAGETYRDFTLHILVPPHFMNLTYQRNIQVTENASVDIDCAATGQPTPRISWRKDTHLISSLPIHGLHISPEGRQLRLSSVQVTDAGAYRCTAENKAGKTERHFQLAVLVLPRLEDGPIDATEVIQSRSVELDCFVSGLPPPTMMWFKDRKPLNSSNFNKMFFSSNGQRLTLQQAEVDDEGVYTCIASNDAGEARKEIRLQVLVPPRLEGGTKTETVDVKEGGSVELRCDESGSPPVVIRWKKGRHFVSLLPTRGLSLVEDGNRLTLREVSVQEQGLYTCVATNKAGSAEKSFSVNVLVPPSVEDNALSSGLEGNRWEVLENDPIQLVCPVRGNPQPTVTWFKDSEPISPDTHSGIRLVDGGKRLLIVRSRLEDVGRYSCVAKNAAGQTERVFDVNVVVPPFIKDPVADVDEIVNENDDLDLVCVAVGNPPPKVSWLKDGLPVTLQTFPDIGLAINNTFLTVQETKAHHSGTYVCLATNIAGSTKRRYGVQVFVPPRLEEEEKEAEEVSSVQLNHPITLQCPVYGNPAPDYLWLKDGEVVDDPNLYVHFGGRKLTILEAREEDAGQYSCVTWNEAGNKTLSFNVNVLVPPKITTPNTNSHETVRVGEPVVLECPVTGNPEPFITWLKDGAVFMAELLPNVELTNGGQNLKFHKVEVRNSGKFTCIAGNELGSVEKNTMLEIQVPPKLEDEESLKETLSVILSRPVTVRCPVVGTPPPTVKWLKDGKPIVHRPDVQISSDGRRLTIRRAQLTDAATYRCVAVNEAGKLDKEFRLEVQAPPQIISNENGSYLDDEEEQAYIKVMENETTALECQVEGFPEPTILWLKDGHLLNTERGKLQTLYHGQLLQIDEIQVSDAGHYTCVASNVAGTAEKEFTLDILVSPKVTGQQAEEPQVLVNKPLVLHCSAEAHPVPEYTWLKDGEPIDPTKNKFVNILDEGRRLLLHRTQPSDRGRFTCVVQNEVGRTEKYFDLDVQEPPSIRPVRPRLEKVAKDIVHLECFTTGNPYPTITWSKDGQPLTDKDIEDQDVILEQDNQVLHIPEATPQHEGKYTCIVSNSAGTASVDFFLNVYVPPRVMNESLGNNEVFVNHPVTLSCPVEAKPPASVVWLKNGVEIDSFRDPFKHIIDGGQKLHILRTGEGDEAEYTCVAENVAGQDKRNFTLTVLVPPQIESITEEEVIHILEGKSVDLKCFVYGNPTPTISWLKDGKPFEDPQGGQFLHAHQILRFSEVELSDSGLYSCIATSPIGLQEKHFDLIIQVPPSIQTTSNHTLEVEAEINQPVVLHCRAQGIPQPLITWMKNGQLISAHSDPNFNVLVNGSELRLHRARVEDVGRYTCIASSMIGQDERHFSLDVHVPASIDRSNLKDVIIAVSNWSLTIECPANGHPPPTIIWLKDGEPLLQDEWTGTRYQFLIEGQVLRITAVEKVDAGVFHCMAFNDVGSDEAVFNVTVLERPQLDEVSAIAELHVKEGDTAVLPCPVRPSAEVPYISWFKSGKVLSLQELPAHVDYMDDGLFLKIMRSQTSDAGLYKCVASNLAGDMEHEMKLDVLVPPTIVNSLGDNRIIQHQTATLECLVEGNPPPSVTWMKNGVPLLDEEHSGVHSLPRNGKLWIVNATKQDDGTYTCIATNEAGTAENSFFLDVLVPARINTSGVDLYPVAVQGEDVVLECPTTGHPEPHVMWYKNSKMLQLGSGVMISPDETSLYLPRVSLDLAGSYVCMAVNEAGDSETEIHLTVLAPPVISKLGLHDTTSAIADQPVRMMCEVEGVPSPETVWYKDGETLQSERYTLSAGGRFLDISRVQEADEATYTCHAENDAGVSERDFVLEILVPPDIDMNADHQVILGQPVGIECPAVGTPPPEILWTKNRVPLKSSDRIKFLENNYILWIEGAERDDASEYTCVAMNEAGITEKTFNLKVLIPPLFVKNAALITDQSVMVHQLLVLDCEVTGVPPPDLVWLKDGLPLPFSEEVYSTDFQLHFERVQRYHGGFYSCETSNVAGKATKHYNVAVKVAPQIEDSAFPTYISTVHNQLVILECLASGLPNPVIFWLKNGQAISSDAHRNIKLVKGGSELHLLNSQLTDSGTYSCSASNIAGNSSRNFHLNVLEPPTIRPGQSFRHAVVGDDVSIDCHADGVPQPQVAWIKDGTPLSSDLQREHLVLPNVRVQDRGNYTCVASNEAGSASKTVELDVMVSPLIGNGPPETKLVAGHPVLLLCEATGHPSPQVLWHLRQSLLQNGPDYTILPSGSLFINETKLEHSGTYTCLAQNEAGLAQVHRTLELQVPPKILGSLSQEKVALQGQDIVLECETEGIPPPKITWEKNSVPVDLQDLRYQLSPSGSLHISLVQPEDMGSFSCIAENEAGMDFSTTDVIVQVPPTIQQGHPQNIVALKGSSANMHCRVRGFPPPHIRWLHNGENVSSAPRMEVHLSGDMTIRHVEPGDAGQYVCMAVNDAGVDSREVNLEVHVIPVISTIPKSQDVMIGDYFSLVCLAEGNPTPVITWYLNNTKIPDPPFSSNGESELLIDMATKDHEGTYTCLAHNTAGERKAVAAVRVRIPPIVLDGPGTQAVRREESVVLNCAVQGDPPPSVLWIKNGQRVEMNHRVQQMRNGSLIIRNSSNDDSGQYKCVASNDFGAVEKTASLVIQSRPSFSEEPRDSSVDQGGTATLECRATGEPRPAVTWKKDGEPLSSSGQTTVLSNGTVRFIAIQMSDEGNYTCLAENSLGSTSKSATLLVRVHGAWSEWQEWGGCDAVCGQGTQTRQRACDNPASRHGGKDCVGPSSESRQCETGPCPVDGGWSSWQDWSACSTTCGAGSRTRYRLCNNPEPKYDGEQCIGDVIEEELCLMKDCPVDGGWTTWTLWLPCTHSCGEGTSVRFRSCSDPQPAFGGHHCFGEEKEVKSCKIKSCPVHGGWGTWSDWSLCSSSCGGGVRGRKRLCDSPTPTHGGQSCVGSDTQTDYCNNNQCPVHGGWSQWSAWGECSSSCSGGQRRRFRTCNNPTPSNGGRDCVGPTQDGESCVSQGCPVDGSWGSWSPWADCSAVCGSGTRNRSRVCNSGGHHCVGDSQQTEKCFEEACEASPTRASGHLLGAINGIDIGLSELKANISQLGMERTVMAMVANIPGTVAKWMHILVPLLSPVYWTIAYELDGAVNGYTLTKGFFRRETQVSFLTGEILHMTHVARGLDKNGHLQVDIVVSGDVPEVPMDALVELDSYKEHYLQTGPGSLYAYSTRTFRIRDHVIPYAWNHSISYDESQGGMPYVLETLHAKGVDSYYDPESQEMSYIISAAITKGTPGDQCPSGFLLDVEGIYCKDDDECDRLPCSHVCVNTPGSYICHCPPGYVLASDGEDCTDVDECAAGIADCGTDHDCENTDGSYNCLVVCKEGFERTYDGLFCQDVNECEENREMCTQLCTNLIGSYQCDCFPGYRLVGRSCFDLDECHQTNPPCSHECINLPGSFQCSCPHGYVLLNDVLCQDVNECTSQTHNCQPDQDCVNTEGEFECRPRCVPGFTRSENNSCVDVDECLAGTGPCHYSQTCSNTIGSFQCFCPPGFYSEGPSNPCQDVDECATEGQCQHHCENTVGSYLCSCPRGYRLNPNGQTCQDVDECTELQINCGPEKMCFNIRGGFECIDTPCPPNYDRDPITRYCTLECGKAGTSCPQNVKYAEILAFKMVALPSGIQAYQDLVRLVAYDQNGVHLPNTVFAIVENDTGVSFRIRLESGKGVLYTLQDLDSSREYQMKVQAISYDSNQLNIQYITKFLVFISVSEYPY